MKLRRCPAVFTLPDTEVERLENLPDAAHAVEPDQLCEFAEHDPSVEHCAFVQSQDRGETATCTNWWLRWSDNGEHRWSHEPGCGLPVESTVPDDDCMLIPEHPGACVPGWGSIPASAGAVDGAEPAELVDLEELTELVRRAKEGSR
ncbi:MAG TPA: hypothetical protein VFY14_22790 [Streptomyces sp.]|nr:hypothetical protein [Streptomyces sp.]